jgi:hypothetical protein
MTIRRSTHARALALVLALVLLVRAAALAQSSSPAAGVNQAQQRPGGAGPGDDGSVAERPGQPHPGDVRPGSAAGDAPSASVGTLERSTAPRVLGMSVSAVIVLAGLIVALFVLAGIVIPAARRRERARGGGAYGRR